MAPRPTWSGALHLNAFMHAQVSLTKGTESYRGKEGLTELCACHQEPFQRKAVCVEGFTRLTQEMEKAGETDGTTTVVKGVPDGEDGYVVLEGEALEAIEAAGTSDTIAIAALRDPREIPVERTAGLFYLSPDKKVKGSRKAVEVLYAALEKAGKVAVAKWAPRGREILVVIRPENHMLIASVLLYESEVRDPAPYRLADHEVTDAEIELAIQLLQQLPSEFDFAAATDEAVSVRQQAIEAARNGTPIPKRSPTAKTDAEPDMMAALRAAVEAGAAATNSTPSSEANGPVLVGASN